jgi:hypothetical protein
MNQDLTHSVIETGDESCGDGDGYGDGWDCSTTGGNGRGEGDTGIHGDGRGCGDYGYRNMGTDLGDGDFVLGGNGNAVIMESFT